jgi:hypothetical protein
MGVAHLKKGHNSRQQAEADKQTPKHLGPENGHWPPPAWSCPDRTRLGLTRPSSDALCSDVARV